MGMFDTIKNIGIKCPVCGRKIRDFQTKDLVCGMDVFKAGDVVGNKIRYINGIARCVHRIEKDEPLGNIQCFKVKKAVLFDVRIPVTKGGRISKDIHKWKLKYEITDGGWGFVNTGKNVNVEKFNKKIEKLERGEERR